MRRARSGRASRSLPKSRLYCSTVPPRFMRLSMASSPCCKGMSMYGMTEGEARMASINGCRTIVG